MSRIRKGYKRYHRNIFFPDWTDNRLEVFVHDVKKSGSLTFSLHALEKIVDYSVEYGKSLFKFLVKSIRTRSLDIEKIFEFYVDTGISEEYVTKACFRYSFEGFPVDLVLVISADGVVITMYVINKEDNHNTLDKNLYERS